LKNRIWLILIEFDEPQSNSIFIDRIRCSLIEFDCGLPNAINEHRIRSMNIEFDCGLSNSFNINRIQLWFIKFDCGLSNSIVVYRIRPREVGIGGGKWTCLPLPQFSTENQQPGRTLGARSTTYRRQSGTTSTSGEVDQVHALFAADRISLLRRWTWS
jgi:hypothetical protein